MLDILQPPGALVWMGMAFAWLLMLPVYMPKSQPGRACYDYIAITVSAGSSGIAGCWPTLHLAGSQSLEDIPHRLPWHHLHMQLPLASTIMEATTCNMSGAS